MVEGREEGWYEEEIDRDTGVTEKEWWMLFAQTFKEETIVKDKNRKRAKHYNYIASIVHRAEGKIKQKFSRRQY